MNRLVWLCALVLVVPLMMGAACVLTQATANPNGVPNRLDEIGTYSLGQNEFFLTVLGCAKLSGTTQLTSIGATVDQENKTWSATLSLAAGTYKCYGALYYHTGNPMNCMVEQSNKVERTVQ